MIVLLRYNFFIILSSLFLSSSSFTDEDTYDFIVVGAGSAGGVVANRLSENPDWSILLLEAGTDGEILSRIPFTSATAGLVPGQNWGYVSEPQDNACLGCEERKCDYARGKMLGGTSGINYMVYSRGNHEDFNDWARAGNTGWSYEEVLPYFRKSERTHLDHTIDEQYHNRSGLLGTSFPRWSNPLTKAFLEAGQEKGFKIVDYNGESQIGFSDVQSTVENGERVTAATAFIYPFLDRPNLHVIKAAFVTKILIDNSTKEAYGVEYDLYGIKQTAYASKEVILSAGAINSPQLLVLSGIGPKEDLEELNIPLIQDLPVGKILYDHVFMIYLIFVHNSLSSISNNPLEFINWLINREGSFTTPGGLTATAYINTTDYNSTRPDIELLAMTTTAAASFSFRRRFRISYEVGAQYFLPLALRPTFTIAPTVVYPKSKGTVKIVSNDPYVPPSIQPNFLAEEEDLNTLLRGAKFALELGETEALKKLGVEPSPIPLAQCAEFELYSDEYLKCLIKYGAKSDFHPMSTNRMGPPEDPTAVVSPRLKVYGVNRLRVIDASVIPFPGSCHTNAVTTMVGERGVDFVKEEWLNKT